MRLDALIISFVTFFLLSACAAKPTTHADLTAGMTRPEVEKSMGAPTDRTFKGNREHWIYERQVGAQTVKKLVVFENERVVELLNLSEPQAGGGSPNVSTEQSTAARCGGTNSFGAFPKGGGCNLYGCWPAGGFCNGFGCSAQGRCHPEGCPVPIASYQCQS